MTEYDLILPYIEVYDGFYREWLGRPLPDEKEFRDITYDVTRQWGRDIE